MSKRFILEGVNYSGKDTVYGHLLKCCKNAIVVYSKGYYRPEILLPEQKGGKGLSRADALAYFKRRIMALLPLLDSVEHEPLIFFRLHVTDIVYSQLYLDAKPSYGELETRLNNHDVSLVLLDIDDDSIGRRIDDNPRGKSGHVDRSYGAVVEKRDLYRQAFEESCVRRKLLLDNSNKKRSAEQAAQDILSWLGR